MCREVCDISPAWDPREGISFSKENLRTIVFMQFLDILYLLGNFI